MVDRANESVDDLRATATPHNAVTTATSSSHAAIGRTANRNRPNNQRDSNTWQIFGRRVVIHAMNASARQLPAEWSAETTPEIDPGRSGEITTSTLRYREPTARRGPAPDSQETLLPNTPVCAVRVVSGSHATFFVVPWRRTWCCAALSMTMTPSSANDDDDDDVAVDGQRDAVLGELTRFLPR